jgi:predicted small lipoprotein YifL
MDRSMTGRLFSAIVLLTALGAAAGCGRKSGLDTPYEAAVQAREDAEKAKQPLPPEPTPPVQDKRFILDRLIE